MFFKNLFPSVPLSPNNPWYRLWPVFASIAWLRCVGDVLVWGINNSLNKHPFSLWLPSKGNTKLGCSGRRKKSCFSQSKPGEDSLLSPCPQLSTLPLQVREHLQSSALAFPSLSQSCPKNGWESRAGTWFKCCPNYWGLSSTYPMPFLETSDPGRFLEDKLRLSALADWVFWKRIGLFTNWT